MKLAAFSNHDVPRVGIVIDAGVIDVARHLPNVPSDLTEVIGRWGEFRIRLETLSRHGADFEMGSVKLHAPVRRPGKIFAIGINYADHCAEAGLEVPQQQVWFCKASTSINDPYGPIELPSVSSQLDHECELVAVIGCRCRHVTRDQAKDVVFGYCAGNDVSVRDWQLRTSQWVLGKSFDTHAPVGPWITTADAVDPHTLNIRCIVNGEVRQESNTKHMIFDTFDQVSQLSQAMTLEPGDLVFTGTCGGVGLARKPPLWLKSSDLVRVEIDQLGAIENRVIAAADRSSLS